jgi:hypothetical protein
MDEGTAETNDSVTLSVLRGEPTAEELAALVAVIAGRAAQGLGQSKGGAPMSGWTDRSRYVRGRLPHSPDGWRQAALPR